MPLNKQDLASIKLAVLEGMNEHIKAVHDRDAERIGKLEKRAERANGIIDFVGWSTAIAGGFAAIWAAFFRHN